MKIFYKKNLINQSRNEISILKGQCNFWSTIIKMNKKIESNVK